MRATMFTRRSLCAIGIATLGFAKTEKSRAQDKIVLQIRADESVGQLIPPISLNDVRTQVDESAEAQEMVRRAPPGRAAPVLVYFIGAIAVPVVINMVRESLRQAYYGGVLIDTRTAPPTIKSDLQVPANMIFVIEPDGRVTRFDSNQLSPDTLLSWLKVN